jgi:hypothetical protein
LKDQFEDVAIVREHAQYWLTQGTRPQLVHIVGDSRRGKPRESVTSIPVAAHQINLCAPPGELSSADKDPPGYFCLIIDLKKIDFLTSRQNQFYNAFITI